MYEGFERRRIETGDGVTINCVFAGAGPPVLLLHGFPQTLAMWAHVAPALVEAGYTVVCADLRGYGDSSKPTGLPDHSNYAFRTMASDNVALMEHLGFPRFHMVGHDRGGRTGHRMALDRPDVVRSLTLLDIVPTYAMLMSTDRHIAGAYWHWYFLSQPAPFPERVIANDPDLFYETCLAGWGATRIEDFDQDILAEYRRTWRDPAMIHGSCSDYRAGASIDLVHEESDIERKVSCPTSVLYGASGTMAGCFDIPAEWHERCADVVSTALPGGHFFIDQYPQETVEAIASFLSRVR